MSVTVLYTLKSGVYQSLGCDCWDEERDARTYQEGDKVICHPPCAPWGNFAWNSNQDKTLAIHGYEVITRNGGILEHPRYSKLWKHCGIPRPGEAAKEVNGRLLWSIEVYQSSFGHRAQKATWLAICSRETFNLKPPPYREPTFYCQNMSKYERKKTPKRFAEFLIDALSRVT